MTRFEGWTLLFTAIGAIATALGLGFAGCEIRTANETNALQNEREIKWQSLEVVQGYLRDPVLSEAKANLYDNTVGGTDYSRVDEKSALRRNALTVLNFLETA